MAYRISSGIQITYPMPGRILVLSPRGDFILADPRGFVAKVLHAVEANQDLADIVASGDRGEERAGLTRLIEMLRDRGVLQSRDEGPLEDQHADALVRWSALATGTPNINVRCAVVGEGLLCDELKSLLIDTGVEITSIPPTEPTDAGLIVSCADYPAHRAFREINRLAVMANIPFLSVSLDRHIYAVGPLVIPKATACYECYYHRLRSNQQDFLHFDLDDQRREASPLVAKTAATQAVAFIVRYLTGAAFELHTAAVVRQNLLDGRFGHATALRLPRCTVCGVNLATPLRPTRSDALSVKISA